MLEHPSISRQHAVIQFRETGECYIYDLGSTHGTFVNKTPIQPRSHRPIHVGDVLKFGQSTRLYILCGPEDAPTRDPVPSGVNPVRSKAAAQIKRMEEEKEKVERINPNFEENYGMWGDVEDAQEESEDEDENEDNSKELDKLKNEGKMTPKQLELYEKLVNIYEKRNNVQGENKRIEAKENDQDGGLTDGQRGQIDRNEKTLKKMAENIESLEETIFSMAEDKAAGGRRKSAASKRKQMEADGIDSDDDEFYNRVEKVQKKGKKAESVESITAKLRVLDDRRYGIEEKLGALGSKDGSGGSEEVDALDAYMLDVSSQQVKEDEKKLKEQLWGIDAEEKELRILLKVP